MQSQGAEGSFEELLALVCLFYGEEVTSELQSLAKDDRDFACKLATIALCPSILSEKRRVEADERKDKQG